MSNKPKGFATHPNNIVNAVSLKHKPNKDRRYAIFVESIVSYCKRVFGFGKHVGSKSINILKQRIPR